WQASSHTGLRVPKKEPEVSKMEGLASTGVVLHLADVKPGAIITVDIPGEGYSPVKVPLKDVLAGKPRRLWKGQAIVRLVSAATRTLGSTSASHSSNKD